MRRSLRATVALPGIFRRWPCEVPDRILRKLSGRPCRRSLLIDAGTIADRVAELGRAITRDFDGKDLVIVPVLKGSYVFAADLVRHIDLDVAIDFLVSAATATNRTAVAWCRSPPT